MTSSAMDAQTFSTVPPELFEPPLKDVTMAVLHQQSSDLYAVVSDYFIHALNPDKSEKMLLSSDDRAKILSSLNAGATINQARQLTLQSVSLDAKPQLQQPRKERSICPHSCSAIQSTRA